MRTSNINMAVARKERVTPVATQQVDRFDERFRIRLSRPAGICAHHGLEEPSDTHKLEQPAGFGFGLVRADCEPRAMPSQLRELAGHTPIDPGQLSGHCAIAMLIACEERIESIVVGIGRFQCGPDTRFKAAMQRCAYQISRHRRQTMVVQRHVERHRQINQGVDQRSIKVEDLNWPGKQLGKPLGVGVDRPGDSLSED
jgi:hypothetical protein